VQLSPTGHVGLIFRGQQQFHLRATSLAAEGIARGERVVCITDNPRPHLWFDQDIASGSVLLTSTVEVYGESRQVEPVQQRATFAAVLDTALRDGYSGVRVVADNTSLVSSLPRLVAWRRWEAEADDFIRANPVTGLCGFDLDRIDPETMAELRALHTTSLEAPVRGPHVENGSSHGVQHRHQTRH